MSGTVDTLAIEKIKYKSEERLVGNFNADEFTDAPLQYSRRMRLDAGVEEVWSLVGDSTRIPEWIPMIRNTILDNAKSKTEGSCDVGSVRSCSMGPNNLVEEIIYWEDGVTLGYEVSSGVPTKKHVGVFHLESDDNGGSILTWNQYFVPQSNIGGYMMHKMMGVIMTKASNNLVRRFGGKVTNKF